MTGEKYNQVCIKCANRCSIKESYTKRCNNVFINMLNGLWKEVNTNQGFYWDVWRKRFTKVLS